MRYKLTPYTHNIPDFVWWENAFNENELNFLQNLAKKSSDDGLVGNNNNNINLRRSKVNWLENTPEYTWIYDRLSHVVSSVNASHYNFDLTGFGEALQLSNYDSSNHGMYGWHVDAGTGNGNPTISRKLSVSLQLTDPCEYDGGNLQIMQSENITIRKQRGLIAIFPSYTVHQVTPVTKGSRQSLVAWISGPPFK